MPILFNAGPMKITAMYGGRVFRFAPGERKRINSFKDADSIAHGEDAASHMWQGHQSLGLILVDEENPLPFDQYRRLGRKAFLDWASGLVRDLNDLNQKQAAQNLAIQFPSAEIREIQKLAKAVAAEEATAPTPEFISEKELEGISKRESVNAAALLQKALAALETGGSEAAASVLKTADLINQPNKPGLPVEPPMAGPVPTNPANDPTDPAPGVDPEDLNFVDPGRPVGTGMGRIPTRTGKRRG